MRLGSSSSSALAAFRGFRSKEKSSTAVFLVRWCAGGFHQGTLLSSWQRSPIPARRLPTFLAQPEIGKGTVQSEPDPPHCGDFVASKPDFFWRQLAWKSSKQVDLRAPTSLEAFYQGFPEDPRRTETRARSRRPAPKALEVFQAGSRPGRSRAEDLQTESRSGPRAPAAFRNRFRQCAPLGEGRRLGLSSSR